ncbi:MAG: transglutaminase-like cysteine peptidase [Methylophilaceae bacterium]|jgi:predicted transglutaminase-like cysteine proteinase|nr:transglutaminase-like cysteine peptidase [Methylophilales bacterium]
MNIFLKRIKPILIKATRIMILSAFALTLANCSSTQMVRVEPVLDLTKFQKTFIAKYGNNEMPNFIAWQSMMNSIQGKPSDEKIKRVNEFFNRRILWDNDLSIWGQVDYWATPMETIAKGAGDCEDFVIVKYYSLLTLGIQVAKLRLVYVEAKNSNVITSGNQAHMVLAYYAAPDTEPLIMDNLITEIRPASRRPDLIPVFSFNSDGIYLGAGVKAGLAENAKLSKWQDLMQRAKVEGF